MSSIVQNSKSILKILSDLSLSSDKILDDSDVKFPELVKWMEKIKCKALRIVESENPSSCLSDKIPSLMSCIKRSNPKVPRVSSVLPRVSHLHKKGEKRERESVKKAKSLSRNSSLVRKSRRQTEKVEEKAREIDESTPFCMMVDGKGTQNTSKVNRSSKRKSSSELSLENPKKPKTISNDLIGKEVKDTREGSFWNLKLEKLKNANNSSSGPNTNKPKYSNTKSSISNLNSAKQSKIIEMKQQKATDNRKNILALRQLKLEQNKRIREEKIEKTQHQRMKLEMEKLNKLKDKYGTRERERNPLQREKEASMIKDATPKKVTKTITAKEKSPLSAKKLHTNSKKAGISLASKTKKVTPSIILKNHPNDKVKLSVNKSEMLSAPQKMLNTTYNAGELVESLKSKNKVKNLNSEHKETYTPQGKTGKALGTPAEKKGVESYVITPTRSSFVSYDISEIRSDSEDEEEGNNSKPIPSWATGVRLRNALLHQHHHPLNTDELFGNFFESPDLTKIMGVAKKHYKKRTSSAVWNSSFA